MLSSIRLVSEAADLAARRHNGMARKGRGNEPYINHLAEVANLLATSPMARDAELVAAGWLHDTIEDTETTREELAQKFSERVAALVVEVTDDMSLAQDRTRRQRQIEDAPHKSPGAKLIKIADKISNIRARIHAAADARRSATISSITSTGPSRSSRDAVASMPRSTGCSTTPSSLQGVRL